MPTTRPGQSARRLLKTQVWELAEYLGVPRRLIEKAPSADLEAEQTDESDLRHILRFAPMQFWRSCCSRYSDAQLVERGFAPDDVALVRRRVDGTHWKRHLPTTAMLTNTAINEFSCAQSTTSLKALVS